ncbi:helix-turn-helix domain-containing protein [Dolichospermum flos-aquae]|uniref:Helix-turn-helix domain-containing protein n=1 Tax=Dolichospermum flos-aquae LEGE 04289 TaxID=1828708 RepID=A0ACC5PZ53_DOLFA|nr:helix-turn-helix domain-containing protein [Dolichospermum flos-aquae]MBE9218109.1 helix-turn-helix domain-containing protein [Dolichospermum flos-aquae LEGE 04289]
MPRSLRVRHDCIAKVKLAVTDNGYPNQRVLARDTGLSLSTISNFLTGKPVSYHSFEQMCRILNLDWQEITTNIKVISTPPHTHKYAKKKPNSNQFLDWGTAIDISEFYGYSQELTQLQSWILEDGCRLLGLFGMGGVGKTTLATQLAKQIQDQFDYVFWRSVPTILSFDEMITDMLSLVSNYEESKPDINRVMYYLRTRRCLIILDHIEIVLDKFDSKYNHFIQIIADTNHQSCLIFTSRNQPTEFSLLENWLSSVRSLKLFGSLVVAFSLIQSKQLLGTEQQKYELCDLCDNNPLKIKIVVNAIIKLFNGDINKYLAQNTLLVSYHLHRLLEQQLNCLWDIEKQIIYYLATNSQLTTITDLANILPHISRSHFWQAIERLHSRSLIQEKAGKYTLSPVVMEYVMEQFKPKPV